MQPVSDSADRTWKAHQIEGSKGFEFKFDLIGKDYTDAYSVDLVRVAPGGYSPVHIDPDNHSFYIIEGTGEVVVAGEAHAVAPGSVVKIPFGVLHSVANKGEGPLLFLTIYDPPRVRG